MLPFFINPYTGGAVALFDESPRFNPRRRRVGVIPCVVFVEPAHCHLHT